jgi:DoxX-like family
MMNATIETPNGNQEVKMESELQLRDTDHSRKRSTRAVWAGRILSAVAVLFLAFDAVIKVLMLPWVVEASAKIGFQANTILVLGIIQVVCLATYLIPRTAVVGAVLWTGYLGGAIATHVRLGDPLLSHTLFPIYVAVLLWGGLWLRDRRVSALLAPSPRS